MFDSQNLKIVSKKEVKCDRGDECWGCDVMRCIFGGMSVHQISEMSNTQQGGAGEGTFKILII